MSGERRYQKRRMDERRQPTKADQQVALEINTPWLESIKHRAGMSLPRKPPAEPTIFRVPPIMRCGNQSAYEPKLVSIGPYHRGKSEDLKAMEQLKWRLLHNYLSKVPDGSKNEGLRKMKDLEKQARDCYSEVIDLDSDQFVEMLLLDGCFIVHLFIGIDDEILQEEELRSLLWDNVWFQNFIFADLLRLENQIPYFVIIHLLDALRMSRRNSSLLQKAAISRFIGFLPQPQYLKNQQQQLPSQGFGDVDHLLHLFHKWILSIPRLGNASGNCLSKVLPWRTNSSLSETPPSTVPTTTELKEAGVKIKVRKTPSFLDISFCNGVLEIPALEIDDATNLIFANLIALEQCCCRHGMNVTHHALFVDDIINTPRDVELLHRKGIIHRCLGADEDIASLFNKLGNGVVSDADSYLKDVYKDLN
uniref:UPF0481 protein At3g47200-like n=1 Tax=Elaeis guineensis var. tenera TaxID=51953 RepID=A0A6I9QM46_ELAGV